MTEVTKPVPLEKQYAQMLKMEYPWGDCRKITVHLPPECQRIAHDSLVFQMVKEAVENSIETNNKALEIEVTFGLEAKPGEEPMYTISVSDNVAYSEKELSDILDNLKSKAVKRGSRLNGKTTTGKSMGISIIRDTLTSWDGELSHEGNGHSGITARMRWSKATYEEHNPLTAGMEAVPLRVEDLR